MPRWTKTDRAVQAAVDIAARANVWSLALDAPLIMRSDLVGRLLQVLCGQTKISCNL